jgi:aerobic carbon-monoxide dehydrogenase medium subunit
MKAPRFDYLCPNTVEEATASLALDGRMATVIAGGQSLVPMLNLRVAFPDILLDIGRLDALKETVETADVVRIGALTTHAAIEDGKIPDPFGGLLRKVAPTISYRAVRNYGTIGGSVALADPAADWPVCLTALHAVVRISGHGTTRSQPIADFLLGLYSTTLAADEIIVGFDVPKPIAPLRWGAFKVVRKSGAFASSIAVIVTHGRDGPTSVVLGAAADRPLLLQRTSDCIGSGTASEERVRAAIAGDLATHLPEADAYPVRLHTSAILRAMQQIRKQ